jgi:hypothetical protein
MAYLVSVGAGSGMASGSGSVHDLVRLLILFLGLRVHGPVHVVQDVENRGCQGHLNVIPPAFGHELLELLLEAGGLLFCVGHGASPWLVLRL